MTSNFETSAEIIKAINKRFNDDRNDYGYFYCPYSVVINNPEHPLIKKLK